MTHRDRIKNLQKRFASKRAFAPAPPPMDPAMMGGGMPMDPAMMGGAPPMNPSMMGGPPPMDPGMMPPMDPGMMDPSMMGGGMPMDPAMMDPGMAGAIPPPLPPPDPSMMGGMGDVDMEQLQQLAQELGIGGGGGQDMAELNEKIDAIGALVMQIAEHLNIGGGMEDLPPMEDPPPEMGVEDPEDIPMDEIDQYIPEEEQVFSDAVQEDPGQEEDYIAKQLRKMRQ